MPLGPRPRKRPSIAGAGRARYDAFAQRENTLRRLLLILAFSSLACPAPNELGDNDPGPQPEPPPPYDVMPDWSELPAGEWTEINPGWNTTCSRGQEWGFFVRPGDPTKLVVEFQGGGACWDFGTCSVADAIFKDNIDDVRLAVMAGVYSGIYDQTNADNPIQGWTHVFVPYCTGDIHWGDSEVMYEKEGVAPFNLNHKGANNARSMLYWLSQQAEVAPERIFVTGCSAGSYGSVGWAPYLMKAYSDARVVQMGDCGAGIITDNFLADSFPTWNAEAMLPAWIPELAPGTVDIQTLQLHDLYRLIGNHHSEQMISQYNTISDGTQVTYYRYMGAAEGADAEAEWTAGMRDSIKRISDSTENFRYFIAGGDEHCILQSPRFYEVSEGGTRLVDWISEMIDDNAPGNYACDDCDPILKD